MKCELVGCDGKAFVIDTDTNEDGSETRRRRECDLCGHRFSTYERTRKQRDREELLAAIEVVTALAEEARNTGHDLTALAERMEKVDSLW